MNAPAEEVRLRLLGPPRRTLAVAESLTGGRLQALITGGSGAPACFLGGVCAYTVPQQATPLGVDATPAPGARTYQRRGRIARWTPMDTAEHGGW